MVTTFRGPRFGRDARPDRDGQTVTTEPCRCATCTDMGAFLSESHHTVTFPDGSTLGHVPARHIAQGA